MSPLHSSSLFWTFSQTESSVSEPTRNYPPPEQSTPLHPKDVPTLSFYTILNTLACNTDGCKIIKYADDTIVLGLINDNDETEYRHVISHLSYWCCDNHLDLNVTKLWKLFFDFRKKPNNKQPIILSGSNVNLVESYKYLGVTIQNNLKWNIHVRNQVKKANRRMFHVRCLRKLCVQNNIICLFYNSVVSSVLAYAISCFYSACNDQLKNDLCKFPKEMCSK